MWQQIITTHELVLRMDFRWFDLDLDFLLPFLFLSSVSSLLFLYDIVPGRGVVFLRCDESYCWRLWILFSKKGLLFYFSGGGWLGSWGRKKKKGKKKKRKKGKGVCLCLFCQNVPHPSHLHLHCTLHLYSSSSFSRGGKQTLYYDMTWYDIHGRTLERNIKCHELNLNLVCARAVFWSDATLIVCSIHAMILLTWWN